MRGPVAVLFALAVSGTVLAGDGLVLVPHAEPPGTPPEHPHGLALYRFPIALLGTPAGVPPARMDKGTVAFRSTGPLVEMLLGASLIVAVALVSAAWSPRRWRQGVVPPPTGAAAQWRAPTPVLPPRPSPSSA